MTAILKLTSVLMHLHDTSGSGIVRVERGAAKRQLVVRNGRAAFAESNQADEHLVRVAVRMKLVTRPALSAIAALMKSGKPADAAIAEATQVGEDALKGVIREQAVSALASVLGYDDLVVRYFSGDGLLPRQIDLTMSLPELLIEAARSAAARRGNLGERLNGRVSLVETGRGLRMRLPLQPLEAYACSLAENPVSVHEFLSVIPAGPPGGEEILSRLAVLGLVRVEPVAEGAQETEAPLEARLKELAHGFEVANHYEILSLPPDADQEAIKAAYHKFARQYHPDLFHSNSYGPGVRENAEKVFTYVTAAYATLVNPSARAAYDEQRVRKDSKVEAALKARAAGNLEKEKATAALFRLGQEALVRKDFEKAVMTLSECVFLKPDVARYRLWLGAAQSEIPRYRKEAEQNLLKAIELDPTAMDAFIALGKLYVRINLLRRAETQFLEVLRWDPANREARKNLDQIARAL